MKHRRQKSFLVWVRRHERLLIICAGLIVLVTAGIITAYLVTKPLPYIASDYVVSKKPAPTYYSPLTGKKVANEAATKRAVTAVMIENSPDARPQSGLKESGVVFEAIAEGGITRFLVLYQNEQPKLIGPVRSLRMYYVDWLSPFNASVAHVGGSYKALKEIRNGKYRDIDQFFNAGTYWRASDRYAPHNVYTNFKRLNTLNKKKGYTTSSFTGFARDDGAAAKEKATSIDVRISSGLYNSTYAYDKKSKTYRRSQGGAKHIDREKGQISPRVVIAMKVKQRSVFEDGWREQIDAIGKGTAYVFQNGSVQKVTWQKKSRSKQLVFTNTEGKPVPLERGQTWIAAVPDNTGGVSWQ